MVIEKILDLSKLRIYTLYLLCLFIRSPLRFWTFAATLAQEKTPQPCVLKDYLGAV